LIKSSNVTGSPLGSRRGRFARGLIFSATQLGSGTGLTEVSAAAVNNSLSGKLHICPTETFTASGAVNSNSFGSFVGWLHLEHRHFRLGSAHCVGAPRQSYHGEHY